MTKAKGSARSGATAEMKKEELVSMVAEALLQDPDFIDMLTSTIASALPARENPAPVDMVDAIYAANPGLAAINIVGNCGACGHPVAAQDDRCIGCGDSLEG